LDVPSRIWEDISMDFIEGLPKVGGKSVILTVVDRFSKYAHFIPLAHPYTAETVAKAFFSDIVRLHGVPTSVVSDRDVVFTSGFWKALFAALGTHFRMSSAFHPQSNGQSEAINRVIGMYLRRLTGDRPRQWLQWLPWAEYCYNTSYHTALKNTPFYVVYGRDPPFFRAYIPREIHNQAVEQNIIDSDQFLLDVHERLLQAAQHYKQYYDGKHRPLSFDVGEWAWLCLHHRPAAFLGSGAKGKLAPKYYGPYQIVDKIDSVAYRLELPPRAHIHNVFHMGVLKKYHGPPLDSPPVLPPIF
jgi:hypothetical protein